VKHVVETNTLFWTLGLKHVETTTTVLDDGNMFFSQRLKIKHTLNAMKRTSVRSIDYYYFLNFIYNFIFESILNVI